MKISKSYKVLCGWGIGREGRYDKLSPDAHVVPVDNPQAVQVLHALADLQQSRSQLGGRANILRRQSSPKPDPESPRIFFLFEINLSPSPCLCGQKHDATCEIEGRKLGSWQNE